MGAMGEQPLFCVYGESRAAARLLPIAQQSREARPDFPSWRIESPRIGYGFRRVSPMELR